MRLLIIFLFIYGISHSQGVVMTRHANGQKEWVNVYAGAGMNEKLIERYYYEKRQKSYSTVIRYSDDCEPIEREDYMYSNGKRFLRRKQTYSTNDGYKSITYKRDGTIDGESYYGGTYTDTYNAILEQEP